MDSVKKHKLPMT